MESRQQARALRHQKREEGVAKRRARLQHVRSASVAIEDGQPSVPRLGHSVRIHIECLRPITAAERAGRALRKALLTMDTAGRLGQEARRVRLRPRGGRALQPRP